MLHRTIREQRGFTLIELVTALALLSLVTLMVFSFFSYGNAAFLEGKRQNSTQSDLRIVNDYVVQTIRFSTSVSLYADELSDLHPSGIDDADIYDYVYFDGDRVVHSAYNSGGARIVRQWGKGLQAGSSFASAHNANAQIIDISLRGVEGNRSFSLDTSIDLPNIALSGQFTADVTNARTIKFRRDYNTFVGGGGGGTTPPPTGTTYQVTLSQMPLDGGTITGAGSYAEGATATIGATATKTGYQFTKWMDGVNELSTSTTVDIEVNSDRHIVAHFEAIPSTPTLISVTVQIEANKNRDYRVTLGALGTKIPTSVDIPGGNARYTAVFTNVSGNTFPGVSYALLVERKQGNSWSPIPSGGDILALSDNIVRQIGN